MLDDKPYTFDRVFRMAASAIVIAGIILLVQYLSDVLIPFVVAFLMAYLLNPIVNWVQGKIPNRLAAVFVTLSGVLLGVMFVLWLTVPFLMKEFTRMGELLHEIGTEKMQQAVEYIPEELWVRIQTEIKHFADENKIQELLKAGSFWEKAVIVFNKVMPKITGFIKGTTGILFGVLGLSVIALYVIFLLLDYQQVKQEWENLIPPAYRERILEFFREFDAAMNRHFRAQALVAAIVGILFAIAFSIVNIPMGILLGLFIGMLNMVPYLQIVGIVPLVLLTIMKTFETGESLGTNLLLSFAAFGAVQIIQDAILTPKIMGRATGLRPAMILLSVSIWGKLLGFLGLVIALPMTCLCLAYYRRMLTVQGTAVDKARDTARSGAS